MRIVKRHVSRQCALQRTLKAAGRCESCAAQRDCESTVYVDAPLIKSGRPRLG